MTNPFKPTAGKMPPLLIGRQSVIDDFEEGLANGAGAPGRLMLITGQRGYGKTVMLTELGRVARSRGWDVVSDTASPGLMDRLIASIAGRGSHVKSATLSPSVSVGGAADIRLGEVQFGPSAESALTLRNAIEARLKKKPAGSGVLFTIDEAQAASIDELVAIATTVQHVIRDEDMRGVPDAEQKGIAFVFAALPSMVDEVINDHVLTFLRRSLRRDLGDVLIPDVRNAYVQVVREAGVGIDTEAAEAAAVLSRGYPYMIQLVGYYMWQSAAARGSARIETADVEGGFADAARAFENAVCAPAYKGLKEPQRRFLKAMSADYPEPSKMHDVIARTGKSPSWGSKYRSSLIDEHVIEPVDRGKVAYAIPRFGEYMQKQS